MLNTVHYRMCWMFELGESPVLYKPLIGYDAACIVYRSHLVHHEDALQRPPHVNLIGEPLITALCQEDHI